MNDIKKYVGALMSLTAGEVNHLAEVIKNEYGIEAKAPTLQNCSCRLNRQQRRKLERERERQNRKR